MKLPGWQRLSDQVWEHKTGVRIHIGGSIRLSDHRCIWTKEHVSQDIFYMKKNGGNLKRALMNWAMDAEKEQKQCEQRKL